MTKREALCAESNAGWYKKDFAKLMRSTRADYRFDDPAEPALVPQDGLEAHARRWDARTEAMSWAPIWPVWQWS